MKKTKSSNLFRRTKELLLDNYFYFNDNFKRRKIEKFIKSKKKQFKIINSSKTKNNYNINLENESLNNIFNKIDNKYIYIQDYIQLIIISQRKDTISLELRESYDRYIKIFDRHESFDIVIKKINEYDKNIIKLSQKSLMLIFQYQSIRLWEDIIGYLEIMIYEEYSSTSLGNFDNYNEIIYNIYNDNIGKNNFYIFNNNNDVLSPISNYSIKRIFNLLITNPRNSTNSNTNDIKYCKIKMKDSHVLFYEENNKKVLNKIAMKNDYKYLYNKYHDNGGIINKWEIIEKNNLLNRQKRPNIMEFNYFLFPTENLLNDTLLKLDKTKNNLQTKISDENNYFLCVKDVNNNLRYINYQYIKLFYSKSLYYNQKDVQYIFTFDVKDYLGKSVTISLNKSQINNLKTNPITDKYICLSKNSNKYLIKVDFLKNNLKNWKILNKKYKFEIPSKEEKIISMNEIIIDQPQKISTIQGKIFKETKKENEYKIENNREKNKINNLKIDIILNKIKIEQKEEKSRNNEELNTNYSNGHLKDRTHSESLINETTVPENKTNKSIYLLSSFNTLPEKDIYIIRRGIKITKIPKKRTHKTNKNDKNKK